MRLFERVLVLQTRLCLSPVGLGGECRAAYLALCAQWLSRWDMASYGAECRPLFRFVSRFGGMEGEFRFCSLGCLGVCCRLGGGTNSSLRLLLALRPGMAGLLFVLAWLRLQCLIRMVGGSSVLSWRRGRHEGPGAIAYRWC